MKWRKKMNRKELRLSLTSRAAQNAVSALIEMNNAIGHVTHINEAARDAEFYATVKRAYYFATQTELDFENIDMKIHDALLILLMEAKVAYDHFCKGCKDNETIRLLVLTNYRATQELMLINK